VIQLALVSQGKQQHIPLGVGIEHNVASQHELSQRRHAEGFHKKPLAARKQVRKFDSC